MYIRKMISWLLLLVVVISYSSSETLIHSSEHFCSTWNVAGALPSTLYDLGNCPFHLHINTVRQSLL